MASAGIRRIVIFTLKLAFGVALLILIVSRMDLRELTDLARSASVGFVSFAILLQVLAKLIWTSRWQAVLKLNDVHRGFWVLFGLVHIGLFFNNFLPSSVGGDAIRGYYASASKSGLAKSYGAVLIDEGHDFEPEWLQLITQMVDPDTDSILLLYDDAQSIYKKRTGLDFSLSSVGIKARGRTTILKLNYRNTKEILDFAYQFAQEFISEAESDDDHIPVISPQSAGASGPTPVFRQFDEQNEELDYITRCVKKWLADGHPAGEIAILVPTNKQAETISQRLQQAGVANLCMVSKENKLAYNPDQELVSVLSFHSSKGLEFETVILAGIDRIHYVAKESADQVRLMYVGMTRAKSQLLITSSETTQFTERMVQLVAP